jgi:signal transduction histidine kinase
MSTSPSFFLAYQPELFAVGHPRMFLRTVLAAAPLGALLSLPQVSATIGIPAHFSVPILAAWTLWIGVSTLVLGPRFEQSRAAFFAAAHGNLVMCIGTALALVLATGNAHSLLWLGYVIYACINGTIRTRHGRRFLILCHTLAPFVLTPIFFRLGEPWGRALSGPAMASVFSLIGFLHLNGTADLGLDLQRERDEAVARLHDHEQERERQRIARELHDSIGSTLGLVGLYADLVEQNLNDQAELRRISQAVRESASEGLNDLRGLLSALAPHTTSFGVLVGSLRRLAARASSLSGAAVQVELTGDEAANVPGPVRLALVRCFQEGVRNALRHGSARHVSAHFSLEPRRATLALHDDGVGLGAASDPDSGGVGLGSMRARAEELGGTFEIGTSASGGARLLVALPL